MATATLRSRGQVTIPKQIRERLGLRVGDRLEFKIDEHGKLLVESKSSGGLGRVPGLLSHLARSRPVTVKEMDEGTGEHVRKKFNQAARR